MKKMTRMRLVEERKRQRWSQQEVANFIGTTQRTVSRWELGLMTPGPYFRSKLCALYGKSALELDLLPERAFKELLPNPPNLSTLVLPIWTVPHPRNPHFSGRDDLLNLLEERFLPQKQSGATATHRVALAQLQVIKGPRGIGKTQIAIEYAYRANERGRYTHILWINAASKEAILASLIAIAEQLPFLSMQNEKNQYKLSAVLKHWLERCPHSWLMIFDNVADFTLIQKYLPLRGNGSLLLTTHAYAIGSLALPIEVKSMSLLEGTALLLHRVHRQHTDDDQRNEAINIVIAFDGFPLALDQAGAYIDETGCSFKEYLHLYYNYCTAMLARRGTQSTCYPDSVATIWALLFQKIEQANPTAVELLRLCALLAPNHIPEELLKNGTAYWPPPLQESTRDCFTFNQMIEELLQSSLIKRLPEEHLLSIPQFVQVILVDAMEPEKRCQWAERIVRAVNAVFPYELEEGAATRPQWQRYLEQAQACDGLIQQYQLLLPDAASLLARVAICLYKCGLYALAEHLYQRALHICEQTSEPHHPQIAETLHYFAVFHEAQGRFQDAASFYQRALAIWEQIFGFQQHPKIIEANECLRAVLMILGRTEEAVQFSETQ